jgi:hypothetical protein
MPDSVADFHPLDPGRIELLDPLEVAWWCRELRCSEDDLREAVGRVGGHVAAVREWLEQRAAGTPARGHAAPARARGTPARAQGASARGHRRAAG